MKKENKNYIFGGLLVFILIFSCITVVSAMSNKYKGNTHIIEQKHYNEANCNVTNHYTNGIHYHDIANCTNQSHNHSTNENNVHHKSKTNHHNRRHH